jgi:hypothetical protein
LPLHAVYLTNHDGIQTGLERVDDEARLLEKTRKDLVDARVQFEDDRWLQKLRDSDLKLETVQSFYKAMYDETTMEI